VSLATGVVERVPGAYYSDERQAILEAARAFAMKEVLPIANRLDPEHGEIPMALRGKMAELGYFGILIPQEYGGLGLGIFEYVLVTEELARAWLSVASIIARGNGLGAGFGARRHADAEDRLSRLEAVGALVRRLPHPEGQHPARRRRERRGCGGGLQAPCDGTHRRAHPHRRALHRARARRARGFRRIRPPAGAVRPADR